MEAADQARTRQADQAKVPVRLGPRGRLPVYASTGSAGCDLFAAQTIILRPGETKLAPLDLVIALEPGVEAQIRPRSGLSLRTTLRLPNAPGTIDSDYRDEVAVLLQNTYNLTGLTGQIIDRPEILRDLAENYRRVTFAEYWQLIHPTDTCQDEYALLISRFPEIAGQIIYLDKQDNPFGTIYIQPGDRIAQMIFSRFQRAIFLDHPTPEAIGTDRGGGFGSTGR